MDTAQSAWLAKPCPSCARELFSAVLFCPFCAAEQGAAIKDKSSKVAAVIPAALSPEAAPVPDKAVSAPATSPRPPRAEKVASAPVQALPAADVAQPVAPVPKATPAPAPKPTPQASTPVPDQTPKPSGLPKWLKLLLALILIGVGYGYFTRSQSNPCGDVQAEIRLKLSQGDLSGARADLTSMANLCSTGDAKVQAAALRQEVEKAVAAEALCDRAHRKVNGLVSDLRLHSARTALDALSPACQASARGKDLRSQVEAKLQAAAATETEFRARLSQGNVQGARASLDELSGIDREHPGLAMLRNELAAAQRSVVTSESPVQGITVPSVRSPEPAHAPTPTASAQATQSQPPVLAAPRPSVPPAPSAPAVPPPAPANGQADMALSFLRDAESALGQLKFDAAKTYVESARRLDPSNPQIPALARRIRERELEYTRKEMTIN